MKENRQVAKMFKAFSRTGDLSMSALEGGMCRDTAKKYQEAGKLPSEMKKDRTWRTRKDSFSEVWQELEEMLTDMPELEAKTLFEHLQQTHPGEFAEGQLRTFQRRVSDWRAMKGPDREVFFGQLHEPGRTMQLDWMYTESLELMVRGERFAPLLCHCVMQYSNWEWATICRSESYLSLQQTLGEACLRLGGVPKELVTDNSSAATHQIERDKSAREFNEAYAKLLAHYGMRGRATNLGCPHENGTAESMHGHLRRRLKQMLLLRGHTDFDSEEAFVAFLREQLTNANGNRLQSVRTEQQKLRALPTPLPDYQSGLATVGSGSTVSVKKCTYSVPSRLIGKKVELRIFEDEIEFRLGSELICRRPRVRQGQCGIDYRHLIEQMLRKPGAFAGYRWREAFFPQAIFREVHADLAVRIGDAAAVDLAYLRVLKRAAEHGEERVADILRKLLKDGRVADGEGIDSVLSAKPKTPDVAPFIASSKDYDSLLAGDRGGSCERAS